MQASVQADLHLNYPDGFDTDHFIKASKDSPDMGSAGLINDHNLAGNTLHPAQHKNVLTQSLYQWIWLQFILNQIRATT